MKLETRFQRGDEEAFADIAGRYSRPMFAAAYGMLGDAELAADAVQEALVKIWQKAATYDPDRELEPWLFTITRRAAVDVHRRARRNAGATDLDAVAGRLSVPPPSLDHQWTSVQVSRALARLTPQEAQVLRMAYFEDMTQAEIGAALGVPVGTVKSRTFRAQRRLAGLLAHLRFGPAESRHEESEAGHRTRLCPVR
ncbi:sigma-70 family RNA polymerase sigma factor [Herbidospora sp. NEAU-GS84]|uniref:Sigma-70 family RNA polymerase sigma factor n=1 Tax=Herbidospora solisilvae TaxID=2696284 RepID=A0A7C9N0M0_9ACTN|nr:sigma-70 family RNA polymerase sigma factor [Herbidospora solisilvae]NAS20874.1 sigma-70 family RNA polymerase sigma factor [Herbidospora solisilvae]